MSGFWRLFTLCVGLVLAPNLYAACERSYTLAHDADYVPYQYIDKLGKATGLDIETFRLVVERMGCQYKLVQLPSKRGLRLLGEGFVDVKAAASITAEREQYAYFSVPYRQEQILMWARKEHPESWQTMTLFQALDQGLVMTAGLGGWYGAEWQQLKDSIDNEGLLLLTDTTAGRIQMLAKHRADIAIMDRYVGYYHLKRLNLEEQVVPLDHTLNNDPAHFMLSRKSVSEQDLKQFDEALQSVLESKQYQQLLTTYSP